MNTIDKSEAFRRAIQKHFGEDAALKKIGVGALQNLRDVIEKATKPDDYICSWEAAAYANLDPKSLARFDGLLLPKYFHVKVRFKALEREKEQKKLHKVKKYPFGELKKWVADRTAKKGKRVKGGMELPPRARVEIRSVVGLQKLLLWLTEIDPKSGQRVINTSVLLTDMTPDNVEALRAVSDELDVRVMSFTIHEALTEHPWKNHAMREGWQRFYLSALTDQIRAVERAGVVAEKARVESVLPPAAATTCKRCGKPLDEGNHLRCKRL